MAENIELARAYVTIVPSMQGSQQAIAEEFAGAQSVVEQSGSEAGESFGINFGNALMAAGTIALSIASEVASGISQGAQALAEFTAQGGTYADNVLTMSTNTHIATDELQALMYAAELVDVSVETMTSSMARNIRSMNSAADGTGAVADAYAALGVEITDSEGNLRDSQTVYWELIDALASVDDYTQRDALSMTIFGRSAQDLNSLIAVGSSGMQEFAQRARDAGAVLNEDTLNAFHDFDDVQVQLTQGVEAAKIALGTILLPVLTELGTEGVSLLGEFTNGILNANGDIDQMGEVINSIMPRVQSAIETYLPTLVTVGTSILSTLGNAIITNLPIIISSAGTLIGELGRGIVASLPLLGPVISELIVGFVTFIVENLGDIVQGAIQIVVAVVNGISLALPELIPAAVDCVNQICVALIDSLDLLIPAALELMLALGLGLVAAIPDLLANIPTIANAIRDELIELGPSIVEGATTWGADLISNFISGITGGFDRLRGTLSDLASCVTDYIGFSEPDEGPLSNFHTYAPDMIDLFCEGIEDSEPQLQAALNSTLALPSIAQPDTVNAVYSNDADADNGNLVIPVYIGQERLDTIMIRSSQMATYRRGG